MDPSPTREKLVPHKRYIVIYKPNPARPEQNPTVYKACMTYLGVRYDGQHIFDCRPKFGTQTLPESMILDWELADPKESHYLGRRTQL